MTGNRSHFGPFSFDPASATLWRGAESVALGGRGAALLAALLEAGGQVVSKADLMDRVWPGQAVEEGNLAVQVAHLRRSLGQRADGQEWITTIARAGYRLNRAPAVAARRPALAILPFATMASDPDQGHFADGMVEDLITAMSRFRNIAVVARQSSFAYRDQALDIRDIARLLGVRYVLEGSVRRGGDRIRVTAQLIDGESGAHLWAVRLDGDLSNLFGFQDQITDAVAGVVEPQIRRAEVERARRKPPGSMDAWDFFHKGLQLTETGRGGAGLEEAAELLERAIGLEPDFAQALARLAGMYEKRNPARAVALAERAMAADPSDALVLVTAGSVKLLLLGEGDQGIALVERALEVNPNHYLVINIAAYAFRYRGMYERAIALNLRALQLNPGGLERFWAMGGLCNSYLAAGQAEEALLWGLRAVEANGDRKFGRCAVAACYAMLGRLDEARATLAAARERWPELTMETAVDPGPRDCDKVLIAGLRLAGMPGEVRIRVPKP